MGSDQAVGVEDELLGGALIEVRYPRGASVRGMTSTLTALAICTLS